MSSEQAQSEPEGETVAPSEALTAPDSEAALRNAVCLWAEQNTRPETLARPEKLKEKVSAVTSFFDFSKKHPGEVTPEDISRWRAVMEERRLMPATVYARRFYAFCVSEFWLSPPIGTRPSKRMANWFSAPLQFLIGIVQRLLIFLSARYISLKTASSFRNSERFFVTFRSVMFKDSIVLVV